MKTNYTFEEVTQLIKDGDKYVSDIYVLTGIDGDIEVDNCMFQEVRYKELLNEKFEKADIE